MVERSHQLLTIWCKRSQFVTNRASWWSCHEKQLKPANPRICELFRSEADGNRTRNLWIDSRKPMGCNYQYHNEIQRTIPTLAPLLAPANRIWSESPPICEAG